MRKLIAAINMTLDGYCDHTAVDPDAEIHDHYAELIRSADTLLYGRITYALMDYWRVLAEDPSGDKSMDDFALVMDRVPKLVFSRTLEQVDWHSAELAKQPLEEVVRVLKQQAGKNILVGSRSLIIQCMQLNLIDEFQLCIHPVIAGKGLPLFEDMNTRTKLELATTRTFGSGAVLLNYAPRSERTPRA